MIDEAVLSRLAYKWALKNAYEHSGRAMAGPVIAKVIAEYREARHEIEKLKGIVDEMVAKVNSMGLSDIEQALSELYPDLLERKKGEEERELPPLPGAARGGVVLRLPPEPSGFMHIGHALSGLLNYIYKEMYGGRLWLRFEDTDPRKARMEYYESFRDGYRWLGIAWDEEKNNSDDMELYYEYARRMIEVGGAYVCTCGIEEMRRIRGEGRACIHREVGVSVSLERWENMLNGSYGEGEATLRLRGDVNSSNTALRDPVLFRIIESPHPLRGDAYRVWPTYDFAVSIEDAICGVTHVLRTSEFRLRDELQNMIRSLLGLRNPIFVEYSRFEFEGTPVSKREIRRLIESGVISGWDDPRLSTVMAIRRRGILPGALREFVGRYTALTMARKVYSWELLYSINRRLLDPVTIRLFFTPSPVRLLLRNIDQRSIDAPLHPSEDLGSRRIEVDGEVYIAGDDASRLQVGSEIRLKYLCNVKIEEIGGDSIAGSASLEPPRPGLPIIQWVPRRSRRVKVLVPDRLFNEAGELIRDSLKEVEGLAEPYVDELSAGMHVQFERFGYCVRDREPASFILTHR